MLEYALIVSSVSLWHHLESLFSKCPAWLQPGIFQIHNSSHKQFANNSSLDNFPNLILLLHNPQKSHPIEISWWTRCVLFRCVKPHASIQKSRLNICDSKLSFHLCVWWGVGGWWMNLFSGRGGTKSYKRGGLGDTIVIKLRIRNPLRRSSLLEDVRP